MLVIDASALIYLASGRGGLDGLADADMVAPSLMWSEATSVLHVALWRGEIDAATSEVLLKRIEEAPVTPRSDPKLLREAFAIANRLGWAKTYDAEYVALAQSLGVPLLTRDARLRRGAARIVNAIGPDEL